MKKVIAAILCLSAVNAFANTPVIKSTSVAFHADKFWYATKPYDGRVFLLIPEDHAKWVIHVNKRMSNGKIPDTMTVDCNEITYRLTAGETVECISEFSYLTLVPEDFKNGSEGTYTKLPQAGKTTS